MECIELDDDDEDADDIKEPDAKRAKVEENIPTVYFLMYNFTYKFRQRRKIRKVH